MTTLALSMIVRDAARMLPACLESVVSAVDEVVIADTGSADNTIAIAKEFGARVWSLPWKNNFAEARNQALAAVTTDWVLSLDADERLDPRAPVLLRGLIESRDVCGYLVTIRNYVLRAEDRVWDRPARPNDGILLEAKGFPAFVEHENVRLFRRDTDIYFVGRVHESVGPRIHQLGRRLAPATFCIHHFGLATDAETRARKNELYRDLGRAKLRDMPRNAQAHLELGIVELDNFHNLPEALKLFESACALNPGLGVAWFFAGLTLEKMERHTAAIGCLAEAEKRGYGTALVAETRGDALYNSRDFPDACKSYALALRRDRGNALVESKLGLAELRCGRSAAGLARIKGAVAANPEAGELVDRLISALVFLERFADAARAADEKLQSTQSIEVRDFLRAASLWVKAGNTDRSARVLQAGLERFPGQEKLMSGLAEVRRILDGRKLQPV